MSLEKIENLELASVSYLSAAASHIGLKRQNNEDKFLVDTLYDFFLVVDGMGGHAGGEIAANVAVEIIQKGIRRIVGEDEERLRESIIYANNKIFNQAQNDETLLGMGCVLTALLLGDEVATIASIGDTRLYKIHDGKIERLTKDHSVIGQLEAKGELSEIRLMHHPQGNEVLRCVGIKEKPLDDDDFLDIIKTDFQPEHAFLLCSDGLSDSITTSQILEIILKYAEYPKILVQKLVEEANHAGGKDNITVIFIAGRRFYQSAVLSKINPTAGLKERIVALFLGRWAFLCYGIILGWSAVYLML
jgi:serine/threonine protein phosphatase PrpC